MPAGYGLKFEKDLISFNLLHLWNIMYLKILWKMENEAFALLEQMLHFSLYFQIQFSWIFSMLSKIENNVMI